MDKNVEMWLWLLGLAVMVMGVVLAIWRGAKRNLRHEQPCRSYRPELDEESRP